MYRSFRAMILLAPFSADEAPDPFRFLIDASRLSEEARETATLSEPTRPIIALLTALLNPRPDPIATRLQRVGEERARRAHDLYPQLRGSAQRGDTI